MELKSYLNREVKELIFKNLLFTTRGTDTYLWLTLTPETSYITPRTMALLRLTMKKIKEYAESAWLFDREKLSLIVLTKVDVAIDYKGGFLAENSNGTFLI